MSPWHLFSNLITKVLQFTQSMYLALTFYSFVYVLKALKEGHATCLDFSAVVQTLLICLHSRYVWFYLFLVFLIFFNFQKNWPMRFPTTSFYKIGVCIQRFKNIYIFIDKKLKLQETMEDKNLITKEVKIKNKIGKPTPHRSGYTYCKNVMWIITK